MTEELPLCECGCGRHVTKFGNKFRQGHHNRCRSEKTRKKLSDRAIKNQQDPEYRKMMSEAHRKEKIPLTNNQDIKIPKNKNCGNYLGAIAENLLIRTYKNVIRMPNGNHGFDFYCGDGYRIDSKSSATGYQGFWQFGIRKNKVADYFLCVAFESRNDITPTHLWLIPGDVVNRLVILKIRKSNLHKWDKYEQPLDKVLLCCNEMKEEE